MAFSPLLIFTLIYVYAGSVSSELILEEGYTVSTVIDGNKLNINPYSVLPRPGTDDLIVLDSSGSIFYTVSFPISQESEISRFAGAGNGTDGFSDGESKSAMFKHPRSFTVDTRGNVYVADRINHAIRKISKSGVTTIAGGYSKGPGKVDGPAQSASFSEDFDLAFVPGSCALLISDHGNKLVRQINLKPEDCAKGSQLGFESPPTPSYFSSLKRVYVTYRPCQAGGNVNKRRGHSLADLTVQVGSRFITTIGVIGLEHNQRRMGLTWIWLVLGVGVLGVLGLISYVLISREISGHGCFSGTWKHCRIILGRQVLIICSEIRSVVASSRFYLFMLRLVRLVRSHLLLTFGIQRVEHRSFSKEPISLLDSDAVTNHESTKQQIFADQLKDLLTFDGCLDASDRVEGLDEIDDHKGAGVLSCGKVDAMRWANIMDFTSQGGQGSPVGCLVGSGPSCLVRRDLKLD